MKKALSLLLLIALVTGCNISKYDSDFKLRIDEFLNKDYNLYNMSGTGYKYYLPRGVRLESSEDYNKILYAEGNIYYLYIDIISYYYKINDTYLVNEDAYYAKGFEYNHKQGYIEINKMGDEYLVEMMYNYAKIETVVRKEALNKVITDLCYILASIDFNEVIIESLVGSNILDFTEEKYNIFEPTRTERNFLDYIYEFDNNQGEKIPDNDIIDFDLILEF